MSPDANRIRWGMGVSNSGPRGLLISYGGTPPSIGTGTAKLILLESTVVRFLNLQQNPNTPLISCQAPAAAAVPKSETNMRINLSPSKKQNEAPLDFAAFHASFLA